MKNILITLPYNFNYRNLVLSGFVEYLSLENKVDLYVDKALEIDEKYMTIKNLRIESISFNRSVIFKLVWRVYERRMAFIQNTDTYRIKSEGQNLLYRLSLLPKPSSRSILKILRKTLAQLAASKVLRNRLKRYDIIVSTMAHKPYEFKFAVNACQGAIKINLLHSWDVITTKGYFALDYDKSILWSQTAIKEYEKLVQNVHGFSNKLYSACPLQFYDYQSKSFSQGNSILYATSVERLVPKEELVVAKINNLCNSLGIELRIRNHPQRKSLITIDGLKVRLVPRPVNKSRDGASFGDDFYSEIKASIQDSIVVYSIASTIALDALALRKNVAFIGGDFIPEEVQKYYGYSHIRRLIDLCDIKVIKNFEDLEESLNHYIARKIIPNSSIDNYMDVNCSLADISCLITKD
jgi:hypothetical protein